MTQTSTAYGIQVLPTYLRYTSFSQTIRLVGLVSLDPQPLPLGNGAGWCRYDRTGGGQIRASHTGDLKACRCPEARPNGALSVLDGLMETLGDQWPWWGSSVK